MRPFDKRAQQKFLDHFAKTGRVQESSDVAGVHRTTVHSLRKKDPDFGERYEDARQVFLDKLEAEAYRRAVDGWDEPVFRNEGQVGVVRKYSDTMLQMLMKGHNPDRYRDRVQADVTTNGGVLVVPAVATDVEAWKKKHNGDE